MKRVLFNGSIPRSFEIGVADVAHHLHAGMDVAICVVYVRDADGIGGCKLRDDLHHAHGPCVALLVLIQQASHSVCPRALYDAARKD